MVAIVILALGVLGLAGAADSAERAMTRGRLSAVAAARAGVTVDSLRSQACRVAGVATGNALGQAWTVSARGAERYVADSVVAYGRHFAVEGAVVCP